MISITGITVIVAGLMIGLGLAGLVSFIALSQPTHAQQQANSTEQCVSQTYNEYGKIDCVAKQIDKIEHKLNMTYSESAP